MSYELCHPGSAKSPSGVLDRIRRIRLVKHVGPVSHGEQDGCVQQTSGRLQSDVVQRGSSDVNHRERQCQVVAADRVRQLNGREWGAQRCERVRKDQAGEEDQRDAEYVNQDVDLRASRTSARSRGQ